MQNARTARFPIILTKSKALRIQSEQIEHYAAMYGQDGPPCRLRRPVAPWSIRPSFAGASSGITRISSRSSGSVTMKAADGVASTITRRSASRPTDSSSPTGRLFPPPTGSGRHPSKYLPYPKITDPAALPIRPERHVDLSVTTLRIAITRALARTLPRCPYCQRQVTHQTL